MKMTKSQLKQIIKEEISNIEDNSNEVPKDFKFPLKFIEWMGRYKLQIIKTSEGEQWYSGSKYWKFKDVKSMYNYYVGHNDPTAKRLGDGRAKFSRGGRN